MVERASHNGWQRPRTLSAVVARSAPLDTSTVLRLGVFLTTALCQQSRGFVHGALCPKLVHLEADEEGLVALRVAERPREIPARSPYRAPELRGGERAADARSDVWSIGLILYEALTGSVPETQADESAPLPAPPLQGIAPWVDSGLAEIVEATLRRRPEERPESARTLLELLRALPDSGAPLTADELSLSHPAVDPLDATAQAAPHARRDSAAQETPIAPKRLSPQPAGSLTHLLGSTLDDRYQLTALLGEGGMGSVFEAQTPEGELVAVKVIRPDAKIRDALKRFAREAKSAMGIDSPHVVRVFEVSTDGDYPFMVMERLQGRDLSAILRDLGPLEPQVAARIFVEACQGLAAAHAQGIVHRDIKPGNLFLHERPDGTICVKLCDFGVVKQEVLSEDHSTALTHTGGVLGTPSFMSPEQAQDSKSVDARSDIWSLCMSLYAALAGKPAWHALANVGEVLVALYTRTPPPLQDAAPWVEAELASVVHRGLVRNREERLASAEELAALLEPLAAPEPLAGSAVRAVSVEQRNDLALRAVLPGQATTGTAARRRSAAPYVLGGVLAAAVLGGGLVWRRAQQSTPSQQVSAVAPPCSGPAQCSTQLGQPARCRADGRCAPLGSAKCRVEADKLALQHQHTVWIGTMFPQDHVDPYMVEFGKASQNAVALAVREIMSVSGGLPPTGTGATRPLGIVACSDAKDPTAAAKHLVETVQVPAVIGFGSSQSVVELSSSLFIKHDVLVVPSLNSSALITSIPHPKGSPRLVWRTADSTASSARALAKIVPDYLEPRARRLARLSRRPPIRVGLGSIHSSAGIAFAADLQLHLRFNGKSVADNPDNFREFRLLGDSSGNLLRDELTVADMVDFQPHLLILSDAADVMIEKILQPLEASWPEDAKFRPTYFFTGSLEDGALTRALRERPGLSQRVLGLSAASFRPANLTFTGSYNAAFGTQYPPNQAPSAPYDAAYLVAYALAASPEPASGTTLARGIQRLLPPGELIDVGPMAFLKAIKLLQDGKSIDLNGAFSLLDFDTKTGDSTADYSVVCATLREGKLVPRDSGLIYDTAKDAIVGEFACEPSAP